MLRQSSQAMSWEEGQQMHKLGGAQHFKQCGSLMVKNCKEDS